MVQRGKLAGSKLLQEKILYLMATGKYRKIRDLVNDLGTSRGHDGFSIEEIRDAIRTLEYEGKIRLREATTYRSFVNYIKNDYYHVLPLWATLAAISLTLLAVHVASSLETFSIFRIIVGSIAVLVIPGYGFVGLIFPRKEIPFLERIGLSLMASFLLASILWLLLDMISETGSILYFVIALGISLVLASIYRQFREGSPPE